MKRFIQSDSFQVHTDEQRKALAALKPIRVSVEEFHQLVLNLLDMISRPEAYYGAKRQTVIHGPSYKVHPAKNRECRRIAKSVERMADQLAKGDAKLRSFGFPLFEIPSAPINDLKIYANSLTEHADAGQPYVAQIPLRRRANQNTADIIGLVRFVEQETGTPHWNSLVILLKAALS